jgi:hypothetical protein
MNFQEMYRLHTQMINRLHDGHLELLRTTNIINQRFIQMMERREMRENRENGNTFGLQSPRDNLNSETQSQTHTQTNNIFTNANTNPTFSTGIPSRNRNRNVNGRMATQPRTTRRRRVPRETSNDANDATTTYMFSWDLNQPDNVRMSQFPVNNSAAGLSFPANLVRPIRSQTLNRSSIPNVFQELTNLINNNAGAMTDVPIPVDAETIERVTETIPFDISDTSLPESCPIDLSAFEPYDELMKITQCGHCFRKSNLLRWFESNPRCPICRLDVRENGENRENSTEHSDLSGNAPSQTADNATHSQPQPQSTNQMNVNTRVNQEVQNAIHQVFDELFPNSDWNL